MRLPLSSTVTVARRDARIAATVSPSRNVTADVAQAELERLDDLVVDELEQLRPLVDERDLVPRAASMHAYSTPMTPPPTTTWTSGAGEAEDAVAVDDVRPSNATVAGRAGSVPDRDEDRARP